MRSLQPWSNEERRLARGDIMTHLWQEHRGIVKPTPLMVGERLEGRELDTSGRHGWTYEPARPAQTVDPVGRRAKVIGHPEVVMYLRDTPPVGQNGTLARALKKAVSESKHLGKP